jgi:hypothetical protein
VITHKRKKIKKWLKGCPKQLILKEGHEMAGHFIPYESFRKGGLLLIKSVTLPNFVIVSSVILDRKSSKVKK